MHKTATACHYCGVEVGPLSRFPLASGQTRCADHFIPKNKGGTSEPGNLVPACNVCNSIKGDRAFDDVRFRLVLKMIGWPKFEMYELEWLRSRGFDMSQLDDARLAFEKMP